MNGKNLIKIDKFLLGYAYYCFVDTTDYLADRIFIRRKISVRFGDEYGRNGSDYIIVFLQN